MIKQTVFKEKIIHTVNLSKIFDISIEQVSKIYPRLKRIESEGHRLAERYCNGDIDNVEYDNSINKLQNRLKLLFPINEKYKLIQFNGDPRGYYLKISDEYVKQHDLTIYRDWGGYGIICPDFK